MISLILNWIYIASFKHIRANNIWYENLTKQNQRSGEMNAWKWRNGFYYMQMPIENGVNKMCDEQYAVKLMEQKVRRSASWRCDWNASTEHSHSMHK